jgi:glycosyltransferase involved in cell wall biosynthesis
MFNPRGRTQEMKTAAHIGSSLPTLSVLMPTYNYASYLAEGIESVLTQQFLDFELLVVDDCSSDQTADVVKAFCARDRRVRFLANPSNIGMVENWNRCLEQSRGEYIKFLFGDDKLSDPRALGKMISLLRDHPTAVLAASARRILDEQSNVTDTLRPLPEGCHNGRKVIARCLMQKANLVGEPSAVLFRRRDAQRGFDTKFRQIVDVEMWFHLLEQGDLAYTREPLCAFRQHARQQSRLNHAAGLARHEQDSYFAAYATRPRTPRSIRFCTLFGLRRQRQKHPDESSLELREWERHLTRQLGQVWYLFYWACYRITRPFLNLDRSLRKRFNRLRATAPP